MKVVVCLKRTPAPDGNIRLSPDGRALDFSLVEWALNPPDEHALEAALRARAGDASSRLLALSVGSRESESLLRKALAVGADEALLIEAPGVSSSLAARLAAGELKGLAPDLVLCGGRAVDDEQGFFPAALAEMLGYSHVTGVCAVEVSGEGDEVTCRRRGDAGEQVLCVARPAVIACDRMAHELRVPTLKSRMESKKRSVRVQRPGADVLGGVDHVPPRTGFLLPPERTPRRIWTTGGASAAGELLQLLRSEEGLKP